MKVLLWGITIFCAALFIHLMIWKIRLPRRQTKALLKIFFITLFAYLLSFWFISRFSMNFTLFLPQKFSEYFHIFIFFVSLTLAYITTYSAVEVDSPSLLIVMNIAKPGKEGLDKEKLKQIINDDLLIKPRIRDLVTDRLVYLDTDRYKLSRGGFFLGRIFIFYRKLLNLEKGG